MNDYSEKLRDPRWQKMRLEILQRDDWTCQKCRDSKSTLNVHHRYYVAGNDPWDYPPAVLVTLCEICHEREGEERRSAEARIIKALRAAGAFNSELVELSEVFERENLSYYDWQILIEHLTNTLPGQKEIGGFWKQLGAEFFGISDRKAT